MRAMKVFAILIGLVLGTVAFADTQKIKIIREPPAEKEYYQKNTAGNLERVREYKGGDVKVREGWKYENGVLMKERKVEDDRKKSGK